MPKTPITDIRDFLTGVSPDHLALGNWRFALVALFSALLVASVAIAIANWRAAPDQRSSHHVAMWIVRALIGCMWFEGMLWKLPLPASEGLVYWTGQMATRAAFEFHRDFVKDFLQPNLPYFGPFVFLAEFAFATSMLLGFAVRAASVLAIGFVLNLWLGIYLPGEPAEWPWSYMFLAMLMFLFALHAAGRSLGLDAWLRRNVAAVRDGQGVLGRLLNLAS